MSDRIKVAQRILPSNKSNGSARAGLPPHLLAAGLAALITTVTAVAFDSYAHSLEARYVDALANTDLAQIPLGIALQRAALNSNDLLPFYGGSEVTVEDTPNTAARFFSTYPTGFNVFDVTQAGASFLTLAQNLAALGPDLRGKKVVISFTPSTFDTLDINHDVYSGDFSRLHANELVFSPYLTLNLKQRAAVRMLGFPGTLGDDPLLKYALNNLSGTSLWNTGLYFLSLPLGILQTAVIRLQDHEIVVSFILAHPGLPAHINHHPAKIEWSAVLEAARVEQLSRASNNPYGVDNRIWEDYLSEGIVPVPPGSQDQGFIQTVEASNEWDDLKILLGILKELGAEPLIMSRPMNVGLWEAFGVSHQVQGSYYSKLHAVVDPYQVPLVDFQEYDADKYFSMDGASHTSREGWVYVDQVLNDFYQGLMH